MDYERYQKQIVLPKIGELGQKKICDSSVLIIGVGGIGCPTLVYLVSMGVGTIGIVDYDIVDISNLHRQFIYTNEDIGKYKVNCAKDFCLKRNNKTNINIYNLKLTNKITLELFINYDYILDCTDNIFSRHIINDACVLLNKKYFFSSAIGTSSQIGVFNSSITCACYRCLNNNKNINETCESSGVLGVTPGIVGNLLAMEVIKFILNYGEKLTNRLLTYDIYQGFYNVSVLKNKNCLICSKNAIINKNNYSKLDIYTPKCSIKYKYSTNDSNDSIYLNEFDTIDILFEKYCNNDNKLIFTCENKIKSKILVNKLRQFGKNNVWFLI